MIGTSYEMMLYMTYLHNVPEVLGVTKQRLVKLRERISNKRISEEVLIDMLTKLDCVQVRPSMTLPAIVRDKNGYLYTEYSYVKMFFTQELADKYEVSKNKIISIAEANKSIDRALFKHLLRRRQAHVIIPQEVLPSVWSYEPVPIYLDDYKLVTVRKMLGYNN